MVVKIFKNYNIFLTSVNNICYIISALGELAQLARASALHAEGQGFESPILHHKKISRTSNSSFFLNFMVEKWSKSGRID